MSRIHLRSSHKNLTSHVGLAFRKLLKVEKAPSSEWYGNVLSNWPSKACPSIWSGLVWSC
ncbi:hypothetical protein [Hahella chejuensis]|uniref:hypothetical protein n=1 Tax=Hahella chejuensis TaxID=158327 RepID=UPI0011D1427B|nr:hypothetical protein [Hahella chejuensis]